LVGAGGEFCHAVDAGAGLDFQNSHDPEDVVDGEPVIDIEAGLASTLVVISPVANKLTAAETRRFFATTKSSLTRASRRHPCRAQIDGGDFSLL
jgi:hypothetical protein